MSEVQLARRDLRAMVRLTRTLHRLHCLPKYQERLAEELPAVARFDPGHESVMMGYDFHLTPHGPQLIEVNTNAGGGLLAYHAYDSESPVNALNPGNRHQVALLDSFTQEMTLFSAGRVCRPSRVAILDENPEQQFLFEEMNVLRALLIAWGVAAVVVDPKELCMNPAGVFLWQENSGLQHDGDKLPAERVDLIYNRHCDFYLETPALAGLRAAYLAGTVCLTPNPRTYGLLADKRRMILWSNKQILYSLGVSAGDVEYMSRHVPPCRLLAQADLEQLWNERKQWVFKPVTAYGSRGVLLGDSISRQRFMSLDPDTTLVQRHVPPSLTFDPVTKLTLKTDFRLFVYQNRILGVAARLYHGQVTNFRGPGSGYARVVIFG